MYQAAVLVVTDAIFLAAPRGNLDVSTSHFNVIRIIRYASVTCFVGSMISGSVLTQQYSGNNTVATAVGDSDKY